MIDRPSWRNGSDSDSEGPLAHLDSVYRYAMYLVQDTAKAERLVECVLLAPGVTDDAMNHGRSRDERVRLLSTLREQSGVQSAVNGTQPETPQPAPATLAAEERVPGFFDRVPAEWVNNAILRLPQPLREAVVLSDLERLSYVQIAQVLQVPTSRARELLHRARRALQDELVREFTDPLARGPSDSN